MKYLFIVVSITLSSITAMAQPSLDWAQAYGYVGNQGGAEVLWNHQGNVVTVGSFETGIAFSDVPEHEFASLGESDVFLSTHDDTGAVQWLRTYGGLGVDLGANLAIDTADNIYITGSFSDTMMVDTVQLISEGGTDVFLMKIDAQGNLIWANSYGGTLNDAGLDVSVNTQGNPVVLFEFREEATINGVQLLSNGGKDGGVMALDSEGALQWVHPIGGEGPSDHIQAIETDTLDRVYVFGTFRDVVDFDPGPDVEEKTAWGADCFLLKLTEEGEFLWVQSFTGISEDNAYDLLVNEHGIYMTGFFKGSLDAWAVGGDSLLESNGLFDAFLISLENTGHFRWAKSIGGDSFDQGTAIATDGLGNIYFSGIFTEQADLLPGPGEQIATGVTAARTIFLQKIDAAGNFIWASELISDSDCYYEGIDVDDTGRIITTGRVMGNLDVGLFDEEVILTSVFGSFNAANVLYTQCVDTTYNLNVQSCGAYVLNDIVYDTTGVYVDSLMTIDGCLHVTLLDLVVNEPILAEQMTSSCGPYDWNGQLLETSGVYEQVFTGQNGCDSTVTLSLELIQLDLGIIDNSPLLTATEDDASYVWLRCIAGGYEVIPGANEQSYIALDNGSYAVEVSINGCVDTTECVVVTGVSIQDLANPILSLAPNPNQGLFTLNLRMGYRLDRIVDLFGRPIAFDNQSSIHGTTISLHDAKPGLYTLLLFNLNKQHVTHAVRVLVE